jgi:hypothetical protein
VPPVSCSITMPVVPKGTSMTSPFRWGLPYATNEVSFEGRDGVGVGGGVGVRLGVGGGLEVTDGEGEGVGGSGTRHRPEGRTPKWMNKLMDQFCPFCFLGAVVFTTSKSVDQTTSAPIVMKNSVPL